MTSRAFACRVLKKLVLRGAIVTAGAIWLCAPLSAQAAPEPASGQHCEKRVSLDTFRGYVLHNSPVVAAIDRDYAYELGKAVELESLTNPELQFEKVYTGMKIGGSNDPQINASLSQPIRLSNFGSRAKVAELIRKAGDTTRKAQILEVNQKFVIQFYTLYALYTTRSILAEGEGRVAKMIPQMREGIGKGLLSIGALKLFEGEQYRLEAQRKGLAAQISALQNEIGRELGLQCLVIPEFRQTGIEIPSDVELISRAKVSGLSESSRLDLLHTLATGQERLANLDAYPQIAPRIVYQHTNDGGDFIGAGFSVPLPFWYRNNGERTRAAADRSNLQRKKEYMETGGLESQIRTLREATVSAREQHVIYTSKVVPTFREALDAQVRLFENGKVEILQLLDALETYNQVRTESLTLWLEAVSMRAHLSVLVGEEV